MGIDIYLKWKGMTKADHDKQITGFSVTAGDAGYLREAYHGSPYATRYFVSEAFEYEYSEADKDNEDAGWVPIPAQTLRQRLPTAVALTVIRDMVVYGNPKGVGESKRAPGVFEIPGLDPGTEGAPDPNPGEIPDAMLPVLKQVFEGIETMKRGSVENHYIERLTPEMLALVEQRIKDRTLPDYALSYVDFCRLAELKEQETGEPVRIYASY